MWFILWGCPIYQGCYDYVLQNLDGNQFSKHHAAQQSSLICNNVKSRGCNPESKIQVQETSLWQTTSCRRVPAQWRLLSGLGWTQRQMMGIIQRCGGGGFLQSAAGPADSSMIALWRFGWGAVRSMGTGDYICVTLRGGAPWGFTLREGEGDTYRPFFVSQVSSYVCQYDMMFINSHEGNLRYI